MTGGGSVRGGSVWIDRPMTGAARNGDGRGRKLLGISESFEGGDDAATPDV